MSVCVCVGGVGGCVLFAFVCVCVCVCVCVPLGVPPTYVPSLSWEAISMEYSVAFI